MNTKKKNKNKSYAIYDLQHSYLALLVIKLASVDRYFEGTKVRHFPWSRTNEVSVATGLLSRILGKIKKRITARENEKRKT